MHLFSHCSIDVIVFMSAGSHGIRDFRPCFREVLDAQTSALNTQIISCARFFSVGEVDVRQLCQHTEDLAKLVKFEEAQHRQVRRRWEAGDTLPRCGRHGCATESQLDRHILPGRNDF